MPGIFLNEYKYDRSKSKAKAFLFSIVLIFFANANSNAQSILLIDRKFKEPFELTDTISLEPLQKGLFPIYTKDLGKTINLIEKNLKRLEQADVISFRNEQWLIGNTELIAEVSKPNAHGKYLFLKTSIGPYSTSIELVKSNKSQIQAIKKLYKILDYLKNNASIL